MYLKARDTRGFQLPWIYQQHIVAQRLGFRTWDDVEEMPHLELLLRLDLMRIDNEVAEWKRKNGR